MSHLNNINNKSNIKTVIKKSCFDDCEIQDNLKTKKELETENTETENTETEEDTEIEEDTETENTETENTETEEDTETTYDSEDEEEKVFIGLNGYVFHTNRNCVKNPNVKTVIISKKYIKNLLCKECKKHSKWKQN